MFLPASTPRKRPGLAFALAAAMGAVALPAVVLAPAALAQAPAPAPIQVNKQMAKPLNEGMAALTAKDYATAKAKADAVTPFAKTPAELLAVAQLRLGVAQGTGDKAGIVSSIEAILATNALTVPDDVKRYRAGLAQAKLEAGDRPGAMATLKAFVDEYGGTHGQYAMVAVEAAIANDNANAIKYGDKSIEIAKAAGEKPQENTYRALLRAHKQAGSTEGYIATVERAAVDYPSEAYWKELIANSQTAPGFSGEVRLDVFRALQAANIQLTPEQKLIMAQDAIKRALPNEAATVLAGASTPDAQKILADANDKVKGEKAGLPQEEKDILAKGDGKAIAALGEVYYTYGDYAKAAELLQTAIGKGISDPVDAELAKLHLGMAQLKSGQKDAARATWAQVNSGTAISRLAKIWSLVSQTQA